jgi:hypothetical protein
VVEQSAVRRALDDFKLTSARWWYRLTATAVAVGFAVWGAILPTSASAGVRVAAAVGGVVGGALIIGSVTLLVLLVVAPRRQRDEARKEILRFRAGNAQTVDPAAEQVIRLDELIADGTRLLASAYTGNFATDAGRWTETTKEDLADLTDQSEATLFEREGIGARNAGGFVDPHAALLARLNYLRDKVKPKLREGYWSSSPFCECELELALRFEDADPEMFVIDRLRAGYKLRRRIRSTDPPHGDEVAPWAADIAQGFWDRSLGYLADRFTRSDEGQAGDGVEPPHDWAAHSAYLDRRLDALRGILRHLRG